MFSFLLFCLSLFSRCAFICLFICMVAGEIRDAATAEADKILAVAQSEHEKEVQTSYFQAMKRLYQQLNFTQEDHKLSLMYIHALEGISDKLYDLNFDKLTAYGQGWWGWLRWLPMKTCFSLLHVEWTCCRCLKVCQCSILNWVWRAWGWTEYYNFLAFTFVFPFFWGGGVGGYKERANPTSEDMKPRTILLKEGKKKKAE